MLVALAGASCAGKTTTARLLAGRLGVPFDAGDEHTEPEITSGALYVAGDSGDLHVERWFLELHRARASALTGQPAVCDWSLASDLAYARALLAGRELARFEALYARHTDGLRVPDVWAVLRVTPGTLLTERKARRLLADGRADDQPTPPGWLERVQAAHVTLAGTLPGAIVVDVHAHDTPAMVSARVHTRLPMTDRTPNATPAA